MAFGNPIVLEQEPDSRQMKRIEISLRKNANDAGAAANYIYCYARDEKTWLVGWSDSDPQGRIPQYKLWENGVWM